MEYSRCVFLCSNIERNSKIFGVLFHGSKVEFKVSWAITAFTGCCAFSRRFVRVLLWGNILKTRVFLAEKFPQSRGTSTLEDKSVNGWDRAGLYNAVGTEIGKNVQNSRTPMRCRVEDAVISERVSVRDKLLELFRSVAPYEVTDLHNRIWLVAKSCVKQDVATQTVFLRQDIIHFRLPQLEFWQRSRQQQCASARMSELLLHPVARSLVVSQLEYLSQKIRASVFHC